MGGRYWITGVQLGLLVSDDKKTRLKIMQDIIDNQFIGSEDSEIKQCEIKWWGRDYTFKDASSERSEVKE